MNKFAKSCVKVKSDITPSGMMVINREDYNRSEHGPIIEVVQNDRGEKGEPASGIPATSKKKKKVVKKATKKRKKKKKVSA